MIKDGANPMMDVDYELGEPKDVKPMLKSFFYPIIALVVVSLFGMWWTGRPRENVMEILGNSAPAKALLWGAFAMTIVGFAMALTQKIMNLADYIVSLIGDSISYAFLPLIIFGTGMFVAFATGTSWGTMIILTPIAIPLGFELTGDPNQSLILAGVVFSGADHMDHVSTQIPYDLIYINY